MGHVDGIAPLLPPSFRPIRTSPLTTEVELATSQVHDIRSAEVGHWHHGMTLLTRPGLDRLRQIHGISFMQRLVTMVPGYAKVFLRLVSEVKAIGAS
jgi:hypothetical protein